MEIVIYIYWNYSHAAKIYIYKDTKMVNTYFEG